MWLEGFFFRLYSFDCEDLSAEVVEEGQWDKALQLHALCSAVPRLSRGIGATYTLLGGFKMEAFSQPQSFTPEQCSLLVPVYLQGVQKESMLGF